MTRFLLFTLYAPLGALGGPAAGNERWANERPGRAAVLGLVAACLGIPREAGDVPHLDLDAMLHYAVRADAPLGRLEDYQTVQTAPSRPGKPYPSRRVELQAGDGLTVLTNRELVTDAFFTAVLWPRKGSIETAKKMEEMKNALVRPKFRPYMGRLSAPLGLPLGPRWVTAHSIIEALANDAHTEIESSVLNIIDKGEPRRVWTDADSPGLPTDTNQRTVRDRSASRSRWQFNSREEAWFDMAPRGAAA